MSERIIAFVETWVSDHVHAEASPAEGEDIQAKALAQQCRAEALKSGIPESEIDDEFDDLTAFMSSQIQEARDREGDRPADKDRS
jgi:membrane-bound lytic murein transglycosylase B